MANRTTRWCDASHSLAQFELYLVAYAQQLGTMDCELVAEWSRYSNLDKRQGEFDRILFHSHLWVLGAYELVRTMDDRAIRLWGEDAALRLRIQSVKQTFARVRIPLAKLKPSSRRKTDYAIAYPCWYPERGIAWAVADGVYVSRADLADDLLELLEELRAT